MVPFGGIDMTSLALGLRAGVVKHKWNDSECVSLWLFLFLQFGCRSFFVSFETRLFEFVYFGYEYLGRENWERETDQRWWTEQSETRDYTYICHSHNIVLKASFKSFFCMWATAMDGTTIIGTDRLNCEVQLPYRYCVSRVDGLASLVQKILGATHVKDDL